MFCYFNNWVINVARAVVTFFRNLPFIYNDHDIYIYIRNVAYKAAQFRLRAFGTKFRNQLSVLRRLIDIADIIEDRSSSRFSAPRCTVDFNDPHWSRQIFRQMQRTYIITVAYMCLKQTKRNYLYTYIKYMSLNYFLILLAQRNILAW